MKPFIILLSAFIISTGTTKLFTGEFDYPLSGKIAMSVMLVFTSMAHFIYTKGMVMMMPGFIPYKKGLVYLTGLIEIAAAAGLLIFSLSRITAGLLILFFVLVLPANIRAAAGNVNYQKGDSNGSGIKYLWFRIPLQLFFILWVYFFAIKMTL
jgi:uncharacterized membrane protein